MWCGIRVGSCRRRHNVSICVYSSVLFRRSSVVHTLEVEPVRYRSRAFRTCRAHRNWFGDRGAAVDAEVWESCGSWYGSGGWKRHYERQGSAREGEGAKSVVRRRRENEDVVVTEITKLRYGLRSRYKFWWGKKLYVLDAKIY